MSREDDATMSREDDATMNREDDATMNREDDAMMNREDDATMNREDHCQQSEITPPSSFTHDPLTPSLTGEKSTEQLFNIIDDIRNYRTECDTPWLAFKLKPCDYTALESRILADGFLNRKLHFDYFPSIEQFVLRMPSTIHEGFGIAVVIDIVQHLGKIAHGNSPSAKFARDICCIGSSTITFNNPDYGRHDPDASFHHSDAKYPGVVMEVAWSQKARALPRLADEYILRSKGNIRVVIGFKFEYLHKHDKTATLSIWKAQQQIKDRGVELVAKQTVTDQVFRNADGTPNESPGSGLRLALEEFAPKALSKQFNDLSASIFIPAQELCRFLDNAERRTLKMKEEGLIEPTPAQLTLRPRSSTPPDEIHEEDKRAWQDEERRQAERSMRDDASYCPSSPSE
ncbi:hypothetical protein A1O3_06568 [Capronia epimyces CBS 606.96]|uniref:Uncharacterized protein n=1 Tax=Capronia epimyces CBS 606.96 TaxID=1182542 RepID=W9XR91_9EURO|nr:uncharacterized protein A1O3_06568 [Capronia epimyces CBS 606.96]EXJ82753.1 hypothetical protein A1O3_06568 [Capronia epimyces CBS 606.96]